MILEVVTWDIKPNMESAFELAFGKAQTFLTVDFLEQYMLDHLDDFTDVVK